MQENAMWMTWFEAAAAVYLVVGSLMIDARANWQSKFLFKAVPMLIGLPIAFGVAAKLAGWPI